MIIVSRQIITLIQLIHGFPLNDFSVYINATKATLAHQNPYTMWFFDRYSYPPSATIFFIPLTWVSQNTAEYMFTATSVISLWLVVTYILASMKVKPNWPTRLLLFALILRLFPVKLTLSLGQINLIILSLVIGSFYVQHRKPFLAGSLLGVATAIKLTPAPLIIYFFLKKNYPAISGFLTTTATLSILAIWLFGFPLSWHYFTHVVPDLNNRIYETSLNATYMNQSITALLGRSHIFGRPSLLIRYFISLTTMAWLNWHIYKNRNPKTDFQLFSLLAVVSTILLPVFVWQHHYVIVIPMLLILVIQKKLIASLSFYLLFSWYFKNSGQAAIAHPLIASHFLVVTVILIALNLLLLKPSHNPTKKQSARTSWLG